MRLQTAARISGESIFRPVPHDPVPTACRPLVRRALPGRWLDVRQ